MAKKKSESSSVEEFLVALQHPYKKGIEALRIAVLGIDTRIQEEVKWNAPSFYLDDHFATFRIHPGAMFQLILHRGAKTKDNSVQFQLDDSLGFGFSEVGSEGSLHHFVCV